MLSRGAAGRMPIKQSFIADIEEGQRLRGWITNAYAQIEFQLGDLICDAGLSLKTMQRRKPLPIQHQSGRGWCGVCCRSRGRSSPSQVN